VWRVWLRLVAGFKWGFPSCFRGPQGCPRQMAPTIRVCIYARGEVSFVKFLFFAELVYQTVGGNFFSFCQNYMDDKLDCWSWFKVLSFFPTVHTSMQLPSTTTFPVFVPTPALAGWATNRRPWPWPHRGRPPGRASMRRLHPRGSTGTTPSIFPLLFCQKKISRSHPISFFNISNH
jgi:hypothetical protein